MTSDETETGFDSERERLVAIMAEERRISEEALARAHEAHQRLVAIDLNELGIELGRTTLLVGGDRYLAASARPSPLGFIEIKGLRIKANGKPGRLTSRIRFDPKMPVTIPKKGDDWEGDVE